MTQRHIFGFLGLLFAAVLISPLKSAAQDIESAAGQLVVERVVSGLDEPWSIAFLPGGQAFLITERDGRLTHFGDGKATNVRGVPPVVASGQGGLLDVMVPADFAESREVFLSFSHAQGRRPVTALARGRLSDDATRLEDVRIIFEMSSPSSGTRHFGSRIVEAPDGRIFLTMGERGDRPEAQALSSHNGTVIRLNRDGSVPEDNPFVGQSGALPEIWSYGHRNPQGAALDQSGQLWVNEHGAAGGDEVNEVRKGANYGWPVISYGRHYSGATIGEGTAKPGMEQPAHYWDPSIAPSGMMIYSGKLWPEWQGDFFIGSLKFDYISRLDPDRGWAEETLKSTATGRVRDIREAPDGSIWFLSVHDGAAYRITPR